MSLKTELLMRFQKRVEEYKRLGINPLSLATGCAVKVDLVSVVYPAIRKISPELEKMGITIAPREDADIFPLTSEGFEIYRQIYKLNDLKIDRDKLRKINPSRAISLIQVHQTNADEPEAFASILLSVYRKIHESGIKFVVGKGHSIITPYRDAELVLFDFIKVNNGEQEGYVIANNDTIQIIDPSESPGSYTQIAVAISNAINDLVTLGCFEEIVIYPVLDGTQELLDDMHKQLKRYSSYYGFRVAEIEQPSTGRLLIGATVVGKTKKRVPTFYNKVDEGMRILVSRPFGDLAPINVYISCMADETILAELENEGLTIQELLEAKNNVLCQMTHPNIEIAKVIHKFSPETNEEYNPDEHIAVTVDLSGPGIHVFKEIAELSGVDMRIDNIPLLYPEFVKFATKTYIMPNATTGTNGSIAIVASESVIRDVERHLKSAGFDPKIIGTVLGKGKGDVYTGAELREYISSKNLLKEFKLMEN